MSTKSKKILDIQEKQKGIVNELFAAQKEGFVSKIDVAIAKSAGSIRYQTDCKITSGPTGNVCEKNDGSLDNLPLFDTIHVTFSNTVGRDKISRIAKYMSKKYACKCHVYENNRLDAYGFSNKGDV